MNYFIVAKFKISKYASCLLAILAFSFVTQAQICNFSLGNDTTICQGVPINFVLSAPAAPPNFTNNYLWDNLSTTANRNISNFGTYYCRISQKGTNIVTNGDFNAGTVGFTSGYSIGTGGSFGLISNPATYVVTTNTSLAHNNFVPFGNHTPGGGKMMVVNGSSTPNVSVWCQTIAVTPNTNYNFSTWVSSCESGQAISQLAVLQFSINSSPLFLNGSTTINTFSPTALANNWVQFNASWNSGANSSANICIVNQNTNAAGNDFALDDIFFQPVCVYTDTFHVDPKPFPIGYSAGNDQSICSGQSATISGNNGNGNSLSWSSIPPGFASTTLSNTVAPTDTTKYLFTSILNGCKKTDTAVVFVTPNPSPFAGQDQSICANETTNLSGNAGGGTSIVWTSIPSGFSANQTFVPVAPLVTTLYVITAANGTCVASDTVKVEVNVSPLADFSFAAIDSSCNSYGISFTNTSTNASSYFWDFGDGALSNDVNPTHSFTSQNIFQVKLNAQNAGCDDTKIVPLKISFSENALFIPNTFTPNFDQKNDTFFIPKGCLQSIAVSIYDRWGTLVKRYEGLDGFWDGKINGAAATTGVYIYLLDGTFLSGDRIRKKGTITLFR